MARIHDLAKDFLSQRHIAVAGVSGTRETAANLIYRTLRGHGYEVYALHPHVRQLLGDPCYPDVASLPEKPGGLVIVDRAAFTEDLVRQCIEAGVPRVWLRCLLGTRPRLTALSGSASPEAVRLCRDNGITVLPGSCPLQFLGSFRHACMRELLRTIGALEVPEVYTIKSPPLMSSDAPVM